MLCFVVVATKPGRDMPTGARRLIESSALTGLPLEPDDHLVWSNANGSLWFAGWEAGTDVFAMQSHWDVGPSRLTAFSGQMWPRRRGWSRTEPWGRQLAAYFDERPMPGCVDDFVGVYSALSLADDDTSWITCDPLGVGLLYTGENADIVVYSNRADLAARALTSPAAEPARDPVAMGWLAFCGYIIGDRTGYEGVRTIPQGTYVQIGRDGRVDERCWSARPWTFGQQPAASELDGLFDVVRDDIAGYLRTAVDLPASEPRAHLTGGKDSRLILSIMLAEGIADRVGFQTLGAPTSPDMVVARKIADTVEIKHETAEPPPLSTIEFDRQSRSHVTRTSGMIGAYDLKGQLGPFSSSLSISGVFGEILRTNYPGYRAVKSAEQLGGLFVGAMHFDTLHLLRPEVRAEYEKQAVAALLGDDGDAHPLDLVDEFYLRQRLRRWFGSEQETDRSNRLFPLYAINGARLAFAIGPDRRHDETVPFELMRRCSEELADMPFAGKGWNETLQPKPSTPVSSPEPVLAAAPATAAPAPAKSWQAIRLEQNVGLFRQHLVDAADTPVFELLDRAATARALEHPESLDHHGQIQLYGAYVAALWLTGEGGIPADQFTADIAGHR